MMESGSYIPRFTIWDLIVLTALVAFVFSLPGNALYWLLVLAGFVVSLTLPLVVLIAMTASKRLGRNARVERFMISCVVRILSYALVIVVIAGLAAASNAWLQ